MPAIAIGSTELALWCRRDEGGKKRRDYFCGVSVNSAVSSALNACLYLLNGIAFSMLLVTSAHSLVGRLRPHFLDVCRPDWNEIDCRSGGRTVYVTNYTCLGDVERFGEDADEMVEDARKSFFSGHTTMMFASMTFVVLYLQAKLASRSSNGLLFVPFLQLFAFGLAFVTALSRVTDYAHHPSDVVAGSFVGTSIQILNVVYIQRLFSERNTSVGGRVQHLKECEEESPGGAENIPMLQAKDDKEG